MKAMATSRINASREKVWEIVTDFEHAPENIGAIISLDVLEEPADGLVGFKWTEARIMFGKEATETMTISDCKEGYWYETTASSHGAIYQSRLEITDVSPSECELTMSFAQQAQSLGAKCFSVISFLFTGAIKKAFQADLDDIKRLAES